MARKSAPAAAQHRARGQQAAPGCSEDRLAEGREQSECPTPPGAVPVAEDAMLLIARHVARELGAALVAELRAIAVAEAPPLAELLTVADVARLLRIEAKTVRRWRLEGLLPPALVLGGVVRWRRDDFEAWLESQVASR